MKLNTPIKNFTRDDISQGFHAKHKALDIVENSTLKIYGLPLCAMEDSIVTTIVRGDELTETDDGLERGYGIRLRGKDYEYLYWHCLPYFPVNKGEMVKRGQIIGFMGNAGLVYTNGVYVPVKERLDLAHKGTHLHLQVYKDNKLVDPLPLIDFEKQPNYTALDFTKAVSVVFGKMLLSLKKLQ